MRTKKTVVILISGKAGAGKTTVSEILSEKLRDIPSMDVFNYSFASPIKYIAKAFIGWDGEKDDKGRKLLQNIGQLAREYDPYIWVKHFLTQLDRTSALPRNFVLIDDFRFPNEVEYIKNNPLLEVVTVRVFGRHTSMTSELESEISENALPVEIDENLTLGGGVYYDITIDNSGDLDLLKMKLDVVLAQLEKTYIVE